MGITRVNEDLLKDLKPENDIDYGVVIDQNIVEHGSYDLPFRRRERIDWEVTVEPNLSAHISIYRVEQKVANFELNEQNLSNTSVSGGATYKREITLSLNLQTHQLLLNGKVCGRSNPRGGSWNCRNYEDVSLFSW
jgi:hypothetical protein